MFRTFYDLITTACNLDSLNEFSPFSLIIIDDAADDHGGKITVHNFLDNDICSFPGTYNHDRNGIFPVLVLMLQTSQEPVRKAACKNKADQQEHIKEIVTARYGLSSVETEKL